MAAQQDLGRFVVTGTVAALVVQGLALVLGFGSQLVLARVLGVDGFGTWAWGASWSVLLLTPATLGLGPIVTREIAAAVPEEAWTRVRSVIALGVAVAGLVGAGVALAGAGVVELLWAWLGEDKARTLLVAMPVTAVSGVLLVGRQALVGFRRVAWAQSAESIVRPILLVLLVGAAALGGARLDPAAAMALYGVASALTLGVTAALVLREVPRGPIERPDPGWVRSAWPMLVAGLSRDFNTEAGMLVLGALLSSRDAGLFRAASRIGGLTSFALGAVNLTINPVAAALHASNELDRLERIAVRTSRAASAFALLAVLGFVVGGRWILGWYGPGFVDAWPVLVLVSLGHLYNVATGSVGVILVMTRHEADSARVLLITSVVTLVASVGLVWWLGLLGAGLATIATLVLWNTGMLWYVHRRLGIVPAAFAWRR